MTHAADPGVRIASASMPAGPADAKVGIASASMAGGRTCAAAGIASLATAACRTFAGVRTAVAGRRAMLMFGAVLLACRPNVGVVATATPEATAIGTQVLRGGGNAIDAAVAVSFALAVSEPAGSGLGGQTMMLVHPPGGEPVVILGTSVAPAGTPNDAAAEDLTGHRATTVPSTVKVLNMALRTFGSGRWSWAALIRPAAALADDGYTIGPFRASGYTKALADPAADRPTILGTATGVPRAGDRVRYPALASTLRRLAHAGAEDFYRGQIAQAIAADMAAHGGWLTAADLASFPEPALVPPVRGRFGEFDVYSLPPPAGGFVVVEVLEALPSSAPAALAETLTAGHRHRADSPRGETTHYSIADADGMVVAVTASVNAYFGARVGPPGLGFVYNDYMHEFVLDDPEHAFALRPGAEPYSSMSATILARDGQPVLALGSPGSARIISAVVQVTAHWSAHADIQQAVAAPRLHPDVPADTLWVETSELLAPLRAAGLQPTLRDPGAYFGGVHAVAREQGRWVGAADPRRDGAVGR